MTTRQAWKILTEQLALDRKRAEKLGWRWTGTDAPGRNHHFSLHAKAWIITLTIADMEPRP